jgi:hypothetical protein
MADWRLMRFSAYPTRGVLEGVADGMADRGGLVREVRTAA